MDLLEKEIERFTTSCDDVDEEEHACADEARVAVLSLDHDRTHAEQGTKGV